MLVLTRRTGESIVIGDEVRVVVLEVRGDTVRLGIEAPRSVQVHRAEVYAEVQAANAAAVGRADDLEAVAGTLRRMARPRPPAQRSQPPQQHPDKHPEQPREQQHPEERLPEQQPAPQQAPQQAPQSAQQSPDPSPPA